MPRNMDLTALRSFVAVADAGGVTRAAGFLNLTQSAVSMQLKRLEEALSVSLLDRTSRRVSLTAAGEKLLTYARRMLELNDEAYSRLTDQVYEGEVTLGVPHDIVYPEIPQVLQRFAAEYPRMKVQLISSFTSELVSMFAHGECDVILTTEDHLGADGETLAECDLIWVGAPGGTSWKQRPLRLAFEQDCIFRAPVLSALDRADITWELAVVSNNTRTIEATVSADLAVHAQVEGAQPPYVERIAHAGTLPDLPGTKINMYCSDATRTKPIEDLSALVRQAYASS